MLPSRLVRCGSLLPDLHEAPASPTPTSLVVSSPSALHFRGAPLSSSFPSQFIQFTSTFCFSHPTVRSLTPRRPSHPSIDVVFFLFRSLVFPVFRSRLGPVSTRLAALLLPGIHIRGRSPARIPRKVALRVFGLLFFLACGLYFSTDTTCNLLFSSCPSGNIGVELLPSDRNHHYRGSPGSRATLPGHCYIASHSVIEGRFDTIDEEKEKKN